MSIRCWILVGHTPIETDIDEWSRFMALPVDPFRKVAYDEYRGVRVSTVFLGSDQSMMLPEPEVPVLFETMIFGGKYDRRTQRYRSWDEAAEGHARAFRNIKRSRPPWRT